MNTTEEKFKKMTNKEQKEMDKTFEWARKETLNLISKIILFNASIMAFSATLLGSGNLHIQNASLLKASWIALIFDIVIGILLYDKIIERNKEFFHHSFYYKFNKAHLDMNGGNKDDKLKERVLKIENNLKSLTKGEKFKAYKIERIWFFTIFITGILLLLLSVIDFNL